MTSLHSDGNWGKGEGREPCITGATANGERMLEQRGGPQRGPLPRGGAEADSCQPSPRWLHRGQEDSCEATDMKTRGQARGPLGARTNPEKTRPTAVPQHKLHRQVRPLPELTNPC